MNIERIPQRAGHIGADSPFPANDHVYSLFRNTKNESKIALTPRTFVQFLPDEKSGVLNPSCIRRRNCPPSIVIPDS
jgi:hypothetical protein